MTRCKEYTLGGKRCKKNCMDGWDICWNHSPICLICFEKLVVKKTQILYCGHEFHHDCIERWIEESSTCPSCRSITDHHITLDESLSPSDITRDFMAQLTYGMMNLPQPPKKVLVKLDEDKKVLFLVQ